MRYIDAIRYAMQAEMRDDEKVLLIGLDVAEQGGLYGASAGLVDEFGHDRVIDMPISEAGYVGVGAGLALEGFRPILELQMADFVSVGFDQITTVIAKARALNGSKLNMPVVIRLPYGANMSGKGYMNGAGPLHSQSVEAWFTHTAGLKVIMPSNSADMVGMMRSAIRDNDPVVVMEQKGMYGEDFEVDDLEALIPIGKGKVVREGSDVSVIATGALVEIAVSAAEELAAEGISVEVIDPRTLVPLDVDTICDSVAKTGRAIVAQEAALTGGFTSEISATIAELCFDHLKAPVARVAGADAPIPAGPAAVKAIPGLIQVVDAIRKTVAH